MGNPVGSFIWYELMTTDPEAAAAFYGAVVGWKMVGDSDPQASGIDYRLWMRDDGGNAGGVLRLTPEMCDQGAHPCWLPYIYVPDVDLEIDAITREGGKVQMPATDMHVGRIAMVTDPQGIPLYLMNPIPPADAPPDAESDVFSPTELQRVAWNELASPDQKASEEFYARHYGYEFNNSMPMGEMGSYDFIDHHGQCLGAVMQRQDEGQPAAWTFYFRVPSIDAGHAAVKANGGTALMDPVEVPGGEWVFHALDPQGATFGLVGVKER